MGCLCTTDREMLKQTVKKCYPSAQRHENAREEVWAPQGTTNSPHEQDVHSVQFLMNSCHEEGVRDR
eukprot:gene3346-biopygen11988